VKPVLAIVVAAEGAFAQLNHVAANMRREQAYERILHSQPGIIGVSQHRAVRVQQGESSIENRPAQSDPLDFGSEPLPLLSIHHEAVHVFAGDHAAHGRVKRYSLGLRWLVIGLGFSNNRKRANEKRAQFGQATRRPNAQMVFPQFAVRRELHLGPDDFVCNQSELRNLNTRFVTDNFFRIL